MAELKKVGAQLVAEGAEQAAQNWDKVTKAEELNTTAIQQNMHAYGEAQRIQDEYFAKLPQNVNQVNQLTKSAGELDSAWRRAFMSFKDVGDSPQAALRSIEIEFERGAKAADVFKSNQDLLFENMTRLAGEGKTWNEIQKEMNELAGKNAESHARLSENSIQTSRAFFALTLASFGLMTITRELAKSGDELAPTLEKITNATQIIASFGSAGAFIGGAPGAVAGGVLGAVLALPEALDQTSEATKALGEELQKIGAQDDAAEQLAKIANVSQDAAAEMLHLAETAPILLATLERIQELQAQREFATSGLGQGLAGLSGFDPQVLTEAYDTAIQKQAELVQSQFEVAKAGEVARESTDKLNSSLKNLGTGDAKTQLADLLGVTEEVSKGFLDFANENREVAEQAQVLVQSIQDAQVQLAKMQEQLKDQEPSIAQQHVMEGLTNRIREQRAALNDLVLSHQSFESSNDKIIDGAERLVDAVTRANHSLETLAERIGNQYVQAQQQYSNAVQDAAEQRANAIFNAEQSLTNRIVDLWQDLQNRVSDINQGLADRVSDIQLQLANKLSDIQVQLSNRIHDIQLQLSNRIADIQQQTADRISDINRDLQNKLDDLAHQRDLAVGQANQKIADAARDLSRKLYEIERDRIQAIEALAFNTHEQLMDARTNHDRDRILRRQQFEQAQIDDQANNARKDALADFQDKVSQAEREKRLAQDVYDYQVMLAKRLAQQKIDDAIHTANVQIAQAQRQAQQQTDIANRQSQQQIEQANRQAQQQLAIAQREAEQQLALAQGRYEQELETAQRAYAQQVEAARRAEEQRNADAMRALEQRNAAIALSHELERKQIMYTLQVALDAFNLIIEAINLANTHLMGFAQAYQNFIDDPLGLEGLNNGLLPTQGGTGITPPPIPVPIVPTGSNNGIINTPAVSNMTRSNTVNIVVNGVSDTKIVDTIKREFNKVNWR